MELGIYKFRRFGGSYEDLMKNKSQQSRRREYANSKLGVN